jgi:hypothetical protein
MTSSTPCAHCTHSSWHDDGEKKWRALAAWAGRMSKDKESGGLQVWMDKACINQKSISDSLAVLPIYLAGCKSFLICAGPTWPLRLWCVLELFTFLRMGGGVERVCILCNESESQLEQRFETFDARFANCFRPEERERLLGVVEAGFGSVNDFNVCVRSMLLDPAVSRIAGNKVRRGSWLTCEGEELHQPPIESTAALSALSV